MFYFVALFLYPAMKHYFFIFLTFSLALYIYIYMYLEDLIIYFVLLWLDQ